MNQQAEKFHFKISNIAIQLSSINAEIRKSAFSELKNIANLLETSQFVKLSAAIFYYYWHSDGPIQQALDRSEIVGIQDLLSEGLRMRWVQIFFESITELWDTIDHIRIDKYLALCKEMLIKLYTRLFESQAWRQSWVDWNKYLSHTLVFDCRCLINRCGTGLGIDIHSSKTLQDLENSRC